MVVAIIGIVTAIVTYSLSNSRNNQNLKGGAVNIVRMLVDARERTLIAKDQKNHGVHFDTDKAVLFSGLNYNPSDTSNETYILDGALEIADISSNISGNGNNVVFILLSGKTLQSGNMQIRFKNNPTLKKTVTIYSSGLVTAN